MQLPKQVQVSYMLSAVPAWFLHSVTFGSALSWYNRGVSSQTPPIQQGSPRNPSPATGNKGLGISMNSYLCVQI